MHEIELVDAAHAAIIHTDSVDVVDESRNGNLVGGNKLRKLQAILAGNKPPGILTYGSVHSSHCLATAYWGAVHEVPIRLVFLSKGPSSVSAQRGPALCHHLGADIRFAEPALAREVIDEERTRYPDYRWVPGGGHHPAGLKAYATWFEDLLVSRPQLRARRLVLLPWGTGTTALGIATAVHSLGLEMRVVGISVSRNESRAIGEIEHMVSKETLGKLKVIDDFAGRYGEITARQGQQTSRFLRETGIHVDPVYNARSVEYLYSKGLRDVLIVNTGGQHSVYP